MNRFLPKLFTPISATFAVTICLLVLSSGSWMANLSQSAGSLAYPRIVASVHRTNLTAAIPQTTVFTPQRNGLFRVTAYMTLTVPAEASQLWLLGLNWTDDAGAEQSVGYVGVYSNSTPPYAYGLNSDAYPPYGYSQLSPAALAFRANAGVPIKYSVSPYGTPEGSTYELFFTVEELQ